MAPEEEAAANSEVAPAAASGSRGPARRGRRSGRGRRGHGRRPRPSKEGAGSTSPAPLPESALPGEEAEAIFELAEERGTGPSAPPEVHESSAPPLESAEPPGSAPVSGELSGEPGTAQASVHRAIEEVNAIVDSLRTSLDDMEEVLEMLEMFERQKNADEQEIESLRRALRQVHRPRDGGHSR